MRIATLLALATLSAPHPAVGEADARQAVDELVVLAPSSLTDVLPTAAAPWSARTGTRVRFSFDATSRLAAQAEAGAPVDVVITADREWMSWLERRGVVDVGASRALVGNSLVVVVSRALAGRPARLADLVGLERIAVAGENVPAGRYAREALVAGGVWDRIADRVVTGGSVRGVLEWVVRGEVSAGVVYRTDALAEPAVEVAFALDPATHTPVEYRIAALAGARDGDAPRTAAVRDLIDHLAGSDARAVFAAAGFESPSTGAGPVVAPQAALPSVGSALRLSFLVALLATLAGLVPAVALGWLLARRDFRGKTLVSTAVLAPLVLPPVVTGFLLLSLLGTQGLLGGALAAFGVRVPFTILGAAIAALVVGLPLYVLSVRGAFEAIDRQYEELSWTLGVPPRATFLRVSLPLAVPGIAAGAILAFARALGEFGATVVLAGNLEGSTRTIALAVYTLLEAPSGREATWVLVGASVALSLLALLGYETLSRWQRRRLEDDHVR